MVDATFCNMQMQNILMLHWYGNKMLHNLIQFCFNTVPPGQIHCLQNLKKNKQKKQQQISCMQVTFIENSKTKEQAV